MAAGHCREGGEVPSRRTQGEVSRCYDFEVKIHFNPMTLEVKRLLTMGFLSWIRLYHLAMADLVVACHMFLERCLMNMYRFWRWRHPKWLVWPEKLFVWPSIFSAENHWTSTLDSTPMAPWQGAFLHWRATWRARVARQMRPATKIKSWDKHVGFVLQKSFRFAKVNKRQLAAIIPKVKNWDRCTYEISWVKSQDVLHCFDIDLDSLTYQSAPFHMFALIKQPVGSLDSFC